MRRVSVEKNVNDVLTRIAKKMGGGKVRVGFLEGATYPDGTPVAAAMYWAEFGHGGRFAAPPRPFFRKMIANEQGDWPEKMALLAKKYGFDASKVLAAMGKDISGALRKSIIRTNSPPLSLTTLILRKRFGNKPNKITFSDVISAARAAAMGKSGASGSQAKPLVWTGHALDSVGYEVKR